MPTESIYHISYEGETLSLSPVENNLTIMFDQHIQMGQNIIFNNDFQITIDQNMYDEKSFTIIGERGIDPAYLGDLKNNEWVSRTENVNVYMDPYTNKLYYGKGALIVKTNRLLSIETVEAHCYGGRVEEVLLDQFFLVKYLSPDLADEAYLKIKDNEPNWMVCVEPNVSTYEDIFYRNEPFVINPGESEIIPMPTAFKLIKADDLISQQLLTNRKVKIAVFDVGIDKEHENLKHATDHRYQGYDFQSPDLVPVPLKDNPHGTMCAGLIASQKNGNRGINGIAKGSILIDYRIGYTDHEGVRKELHYEVFSIIRAFYQATFVDKVDVVNCSWSISGVSSALGEMIKLCIKKGRNSLGLPVVFSAGNLNRKVKFPNNLNEVFTVSASNAANLPKKKTGDEDWGSNYGTQEHPVDVAAPGIDVVTTDLTGYAGNDSSNHVRNFSGTSASAPMVSACIGLLLSISPELRLSQIKRIIKSSSNPFNSPSYEYGTGVLDIKKAIQRLNTFTN